LIGAIRNKPYVQSISVFARWPVSHPLPLAKDLEHFQFEGTPINQTLVNDLAGGGFIAKQRNAVPVGGTGTGKTHLAIAIARSCIGTMYYPLSNRFYIGEVNRAVHSCDR
jgi:IstB-like ATP binding protein